MELEQRAMAVANLNEEVVIDVDLRKKASISRKSIDL
jgi:hypothetical protein